MGRRCCVSGCNSTSRLPEHHGVTYHSIPLDSAIRAVWLKNIRFSVDRQITKSVLVCSRHFRRADFQPQRSGKYLLKQRVFPTVFPWGKVDPAQIAEDLEQLKNAPSAPPAQSAIAAEAIVEAKVKQIMAETAELKAAASAEGDASDRTASTASPISKFEPVSSFNPGTRLEAQDFDGVWHAARIVEVDNDDREVLIKFERSNKNKSAIAGTEEWIPMNSTRLRQKVPSRPIQIFQLDERCMARWSGPRKYPGLVKKILGNDVYEVLFDDGYTKNVRAIHMTKRVQESKVVAASAEGRSTPNVVTPVRDTSTPKMGSSGTADTGSGSKKRTTSVMRKDWPLLDLSKLDLATLNLPKIPQDGEWTCHWVNDQPIGIEGFLVVGEHRKPTVIVEDWRLPPGWIKHMYQRSNVLGKWDVILVSPNGKRFRSKSDLKTYLESEGQFYNPDIYDFSIHRRRAKDINAYVFTSDYTPQQLPKSRTVDSSLELQDPTTAELSNSLTGRSSYIETPVVTPLPPMELMTTTNVKADNTDDDKAMLAGGAGTSSSVVAKPSAEEGYVYIGGLKVEIIENLFRCPEKDCSKNFRKENHLQIHVKHYHRHLAKLLGACPKMQELAEKRTHTTTIDQNEAHPKNQIPNQQFFAKLHQQDMAQSRGHRKANTGGVAPTTSAEVIVKTEKEVKSEVQDTLKTEKNDVKDTSLTGTSANNAPLDKSAVSASLAESILSTNSFANSSPQLSNKRARFPVTKRITGSRKSNRQRTTRRYLTAAQATGSARLKSTVPKENSFRAADFEETRHSFNATPDVKVFDVRKRKSNAALASTTPQSSIDSPVTADSGSLHGLSSNEADVGSTGAHDQYIKEDGELIRIVSMRQEEIINCLCGYGEEDGLMIQCELCLCWQHGGCNGIDKESEVPDNYVCYICRNPPRRRDSMRFIHDQEWLYEGKLPTASYHTVAPHYQKRSDLLKKTHTLAGYLYEMDEFMYSLGNKINIAQHRAHPKLYLWAKRWDDSHLQNQESALDIKEEQDVKPDVGDIADTKSLELKRKETIGTPTESSPNKKPKTEVASIVPQPEAAIDFAECHQRLIEHIKAQQDFVESRLNEVEAEMDEIEAQDDLPDLKDANMDIIKQVLATYLKDTDMMRQLARSNSAQIQQRANNYRI